MNWKRKIQTKIYGGSLANLNRIEKEFPPLHIRKYTEHDYDRCSEIYLLNEPTRFPKGLLKDYQTSLVEKESLYLVAEVDGNIIGASGLSVFEFTDKIRVPTLSYGLIDPAYHGRGYGTVLLVFRLSLLDTDRWSWLVSMTSAGNGTENFYKAFGFYYVARSPCIGNEETMLDIYHLRVPKEDIRLFREKILSSPVSVSGHENFHIPSHDRREEFARLLAEEGAKK